jgi:hypothetical protein
MGRSRFANLHRRFGPGTAEWVEKAELIAMARIGTHAGMPLRPEYGKFKAV